MQCFERRRKKGEGRRGKQRTKEKHSSEEKKLNEKRRTKRATMPLFESCFSELRVDGRRLYLKGVNWFGFEV